MPYKDPENYSFVTWVWVLAVSFLGGTVRHFTKAENGEPLTLKGWIMDVIIAAFVGVVTFFLCEYAGFPQVLTAALVGVTSHLGTRGLILIYRVLLKRLHG